MPVIILYLVPLCYYSLLSFWPVLLAGGGALWVSCPRLPLSSRGWVLQAVLAQSKRHIIVQNACCHFFMYPPWRGISLLLYYLPRYYLTPILQCGRNDMFVFSIHDCPALACTVTVFTAGIPYCAGVVSFFSFMFPHFVSFVHLINPPFVWLIDLISSVVPTSLFV